MKFIPVLLVLLVKLLYVENRMLPRKHVVLKTFTVDEPGQNPQFPTDEGTYEAPLRAARIAQTEMRDEENINEKVIGLKNGEYKTEDDNSYDFDRNPPAQTVKEPCAVVVLSNIQNPSMQSLLRKYRYDENGVLIPSSVKYFIKLPQGVGAAPLLVPLNDKAFSPLGGFVRYYKEVPPIPQAW